MRASFIIVSNRLPVSVTKVDGKLSITPSSGGLATAMDSLDGDPKDRVWIGWPGIASDNLTEDDKATIRQELEKLGCLPVFLTQEQVSGFYDGYSNDTLWPLFHYFYSTASFNPDYWNMYREINILYQEAVLRQASPQATIWIHDYHLMTLPALLREKLPRSLIGFFLHTPFPSFEVFRLLPERGAILRGLLGADLIGFQTYDYVQHFTNSVQRLLGYKTTGGTIPLAGHTAMVDAFPIGINYERFAEAAVSAEVKIQVDDLDEHYKDQKLILSVDRLDYSKGINQRLEAYERFLAKYPTWHKRVVLVMVAVPSRTDIASYQQLRDTIEQSISRINGLYGSIDWTPISYQFQNLPFEQVVALYSKAVVALVTPLRDGMNLVAKEYVASKQDRSGVLILSELAGAVDELSEALLINPTDTDAVADTIQHALSMPVASQRRRMLLMQRWLARYTVSRWANDFLEQLSGARAVHADHRDKHLSTERRHRIVSAFSSAKRRAIFLDYDGTLTGFADGPEPHLAKPQKRLLQTLDSLASQPHTSVAIVSGRSREALEEWFGDMPLTLIAEHGAWVRRGKRWVQEAATLQPYRDQLLEILESYTRRTAGAVIEAKNVALVWHYRNVAPQLAYARNASLMNELQTLLSGSDLGIYQGHKIIEIRPRAVDKGTAVAEIVATKPADFILCIGDDYTDEDMFNALPETAYTIRVGLGDSRARYHIDSPDKVLSFLRELSR